VRPNQVVTRAEFAALVNRLFQFNVKVGIDFADVCAYSSSDTSIFARFIVAFSILGVHFLV
jgi:hypothetical protein